MVLGFPCDQFLGQEPESNETVVVDMGSAINATPGGNTTHTATITDDDAAPSVTFSSASQDVAENVGTASVNAVLSAASGKTITVALNITNLSAESSDYSRTTALPIVFSAGSTCW